MYVPARGDLFYFNIQLISMDYEMMALTETRCSRMGILI